MAENEENRKVLGITLNRVNKIFWLFLKQILLFLQPDLCFIYPENLGNTEPAVSYALLWCFAVTAALMLTRVV